MAWCKRDVSDFFRWNFFSFKSAWIFACAFQLSRKTFSCIVFWLKCSCSALFFSLCTLQYFVFVFLRNKVQTRQKKYRGMLYYLIEKHMQKFRHFWRKTNFTWKSHLRPSCTKPFNYSMSPSWIWSDKITNKHVARVGYNHFISNKGEWNNCFSKFSNRVLLPIFISTILQSRKFLNLAHYFPDDVKLWLFAHSRSFLANQKARNAIVRAENLLKNNILLTLSSQSIL